MKHGIRNIHNNVNTSNNLKKNEYNHMSQCSVILLCQNTLSIRSVCVSIILTQLLSRVSEFSPSGIA